MAKKQTYDGNTNRDVQVNLTVPAWVKNEVAGNYWNYREIFLLGFQAKKDNPQFIERINKLERAVSDIEKKIYSMLQRQNEFLYYIKETTNKK